MECKQSFKVEASKSLFAIGSGWGGGGGEFWGNKVNYGKCANGEQELILARPSICAFQVSFFLRCIGIICLTLYIYLFQYFENLDLVENIVFQILKNIRYPF